jgi:D-3-phosphoglycerate dehydrogenase
MLIRGVPRAARYIADGGALAESAFEGSEFFGREAPGTVLGLVGFGHVGQHVATRAAALGFTVVAHDPMPPPVVPDHVRLAGFADLLAESDVVSVHARAAADNRHLFGPEAFGQMKPGAGFINTARESLVDEAALAAALRSGRLAGAALDVVERPADGTRHPLLDIPSVYITPHIGGATAQTLRRGAQQAAAAIAAVLAGDTPAAVVNPGVFDRAEAAI